MARYCTICRFDLRQGPAQHFCSGMPYYCGECGQSVHSGPCAPVATTEGPDFRAVPVPGRIRALQRDRRGYPVPFIVLRDKHGKPHFAVNDGARQRQCLEEKRCPICGGRLDKQIWFVGGPGSAFHPRGSYIDTATHHSCMTYAMQVCPYLAAPNYNGTVGAGTVRPEDLEPEQRLLLDSTTDPARPVVFVAVGATGFTIRRYTPSGVIYVVPKRPYEGVEFWVSGEKVSQERGMALVEADAELPEGTVAEMKRMLTPAVVLKRVREVRGGGGREFNVRLTLASADVLRRCRKTLTDTGEGATEVYLVTRPQDLEILERHEER